MTLPIGPPAKPASVIRRLMVLVLAPALGVLSAQSDASSRFALSAYGELYYGYDFSRPDDHERPFFVYNHKRHNEVNANLLLVRGAYTDSLVRASLGLMAGTYAQYNLSAEPGWAQFIYEATIGLKLSRRKNLWLDAGIMPSHLGYESVIGADNWTLTRSLAAEGSPYYETGIRLIHTSRDDRWTTSLLLLNGWQRIQRPDGHQRPSVGMQLTFRPDASLTLNYSNFIGSDKPDSMHSTRVFHDLYAVWTPGDRFGLTAGFDLGTESIRDRGTHLWLTPSLILRYALSDSWIAAFRAEYYADPDGVIFAPAGSDGMTLFGLSANVDMHVSPHALIRLEGKTYLSEDAVFAASSTSNSAVTAAIIASW